MTTISHLHKLKREQRKWAALTACDASFSRLLNEAGINVMLVGDSLSMTVQGHGSTLPVTMDEMVYHTKCARRGAPKCFLIGDMPFMSYGTPTQACENAAALMRAGANMVKLEGGEWLTETIKNMTTQGIAVCAHIGLTPQSVNVLGGYKIQGRDQATADRLLNDALALEKAGAQLLLMECVPVALAEKITKALTIPTLGVGAGPRTDAQILVTHDVLGITGKGTPSFAKDFLAISGGSISDAIRLYVQHVESGQFPSNEHSFN